MSDGDGLALGYLAVLAGRAVEDATTPVAATLGVSRAEINLLYEVATHAPVTTSSLARVLCVRSSAITPLTSNLKKTGLIERSYGDRDRRQRWWRLTEDGAAYLGRAGGVVAPEVDRVFAALGPHEAARLADLLSKVVAPWLAQRVDTAIGGAA